MHDTTFAGWHCPVQTLYYHKNFMEEDDHVEGRPLPRGIRESVYSRFVVRAYGLGRAWHPLHWQRHQVAGLPYGAAEGNCFLSAPGLEDPDGAYAASGGGSRWAGNRPESERKLCPSGLLVGK